MCGGKLVPRSTATCVECMITRHSLSLEECGRNFHLGLVRPLSAICINHWRASCVSLRLEQLISEKKERRPYRRYGCSYGQGFREVQGSEAGSGFWQGLGV